ncbi:gluconokinase [Starkeya sp. ORNL1]|uniref:gluconokinase n=1 Tax=Starkeya sp. ORNL1 TaxID=2709380 RepID=UPI001FEDA264|nr:gluconokinase [Starkeya sp. ORNL1]
MTSASVPPIIVVMGVAGSGKSSIGAALAARHGWAFLEGDDLHPPANVARMAHGLPLTDADRQEWLAAIARHIAEADRAGTGLVVACSALKRRYRDQLSAASERLLYLFLAGDKALITARMAHREGHFMPLSLIDSQFEALEPPQPDERALTLPITLEPGELLEEIDRRLASLWLHGLRQGEAAQ